MSPAHVSPDLTKAELSAIAAERGVEVPARATKAQILRAIEGA